MKKLFLMFTLTFVVAPYATSLPSMGSKPESFLKERIENSPQYNSEKEQFENVHETPIVSDGGTRFDMLVRVMKGEGKNRVPEQPLPEDTTALSALAAKAENARFIWFGHSTILLELDGTRILLDPMFSKYASPIPGFAKRFQASVYALEDIEDIDVVLISHDHYDHLDYKTIKQLKGKDIKFFVPLGVGAHLRHWGVDNSLITELDWWEDTTFNNITFTATPSQHFSGRNFFNGNKTQWASWSVQGKQQNIFFSGDSGYSEHYQAIGDKLGPFDLAFLENGAYNDSWRFIHQHPEEAVQANIDLKSRRMVPIHWGLFDLSFHSWYEPIERVIKEADAKGVELIMPRMGQLVDVQGEFAQEQWWDLVKK